MSQQAHPPNDSLVIRPELPEDEADIYTLTAAAFDGKPYAGGDEQDVVDRLRAAGALSLSLVALRGNRLVGHAAFSPAQCPDPTQNWFALGPISVAPDVQGQSIGRALIEAGLQALRDKAADGCMLTGNPDLYRKFGFELSPAHTPENEPPEHFMVRPFGAHMPDGRFAFHAAFYGDLPEDKD